MRSTRGSPAATNHPASHPGGAPCGSDVRTNQLRPLLGTHTQTLNPDSDSSPQSPTRDGAHGRAAGETHGARLGRQPRLLVVREEERVDADTQVAQAFRQHDRMGAQKVRVARRDQGRRKSGRKVVGNRGQREALIPPEAAMAAGGQRIAVAIDRPSPEPSVSSESS
jgi:hypothetical protein